MHQKIEAGSREVRHLTARLQHPERHLQVLSQRLDHASQRLAGIMSHRIEATNVEGLQRRLETAIHSRFAGLKLRLQQQTLASPLSKLLQQQNRVDLLSGKLQRLEHERRQTKSAQVKQAAAKLNALSPLATLERGFAIVSHVESATIITDAEALNLGDRVHAKLQSGEFIAEVTDKTVNDKTASRDASNEVIKDKE